jgi:hypothetical protein
MREMREQVRRMHNEADTGAELVELDELRALTEVAPTAIHIFQACPFSTELLAFWPCTVTRNHSSRIFLASCNR